MGKSEKNQGSSDGDQNLGILLRDSSQWRVWISHIKSAATGEEVWDYMDPDLSESAVLKAPTMGRMTWPTPSEVNPEAQSISDLSPTEHSTYKDMVYLFKEERSFKHSVTKAIARLHAQIKSCVAPEWHGILADRITPYEQLVRLKQQFAPRKNTRVQDLRNDWRKMVDSPIGKTSLDRWLLNWSNLYDEAKAAKVPDVCYTDNEYPPDSMAIRDLLQAIQLQDAYFANQWRQRLTEYEERRISQRTTSESSTALVKVDSFAPTFHGVLSDYRDHRQVQNQAPLAGGSGRLAFTATLNGQPPAGRNQQNPQKKLCLCGRPGHPWKRCYEINWTLRPTDFKSNEEARKKIEENLKREPTQVQQEIVQMLQSDPSRKGKTAQLSITASDDLPRETIAFFTTATISPKVYHAAMTYSLKNNWVVDSGANVHICNQRERFIDLRKDSAEITLGDGHSISQGRGTARIIVRNPDSGKTQWATLTDVWYAPDFATNIISVSEIKKKGFFFTSELPGIVSAIGPTAKCQEMYGLYLLENGDTGPSLRSHPAALASLKTSEKPVISSASPEMWHRRLGHTYARRIETLAKMVDGVDIREGGTFEERPEICETCQLNPHPGDMKCPM